ncbi:uncharacterized protein LOC112536885 [Ricinus communis]|uniref:Uncharacterized protein n=1 Tax=Ricinus communis TaxID=3988 RepID=B9T4C1_RICCO|nr:uncharacterized protein LOC112536885 [Ricinus communis]EEF29292.1 conserved hypothetical protein [Ricinus communis]|eukprot:XP_025015553.1 uncharacterized protein LOC112536885 [Ricinus communis]
MDSEHASVTRRKVSVLQGDEFFFNKVISRNSSMSCSSRLFYYRSAEGVPFQWEMQPGTAKDPPQEEVLPPLSPPPAVLSLGLPKPCIHDLEEPKVSIKSKLKFWKHIRKIQGSKKGPQGFLQRNNNNQNIVNVNNGSDCKKFESFEFCSSDGEFMVSPRNSSFSSSFSSSSSSSSALSLTKGHSKKSSRLEGPARDSLQGINGCSPWKFNSFLVYVARRV